MTDVQQFTTTGYSRFIDSHLVERLIEDCMQVTFFDNFFTGRTQKSLLQ
jgi:nucleoside-diphosphate-sugar epimerase